MLCFKIVKKKIRFIGTLKSLGNDHSININHYENKPVNFGKVASKKKKKKSPSKGLKKKKKSPSKGLNKKKKAHPGP